MESRDQSRYRFGKLSPANSAKWPVDLQLIIFSTTFGWRCGLSPATQTSGDASYRDAVLEIARELQSIVRLVDSEADKKNPPG